jgi:glutamyl-tRNA synthetase
VASTDGVAVRGAPGPLAPRRDARIHCLCICRLFVREGATIDLKSRVRVRFAPSPTGSLHIGSARTALFNYLFARRQGGVFVLRIEDTDTLRSEERHERSILTDLAWLGLHWDEGPDIGGPFGPYRQSQRAAAHTAAAARLLSSGAAYRCFCSEERLEALRAEQLARGQMPKYDRRCAAIDPAAAEARALAGEPAAPRLRVPEGEIVVDDIIRGRIVFSSDAIGDFILLRSNGLAGYNFAAAVDDRDMQMTHVIRGDDHLTNTARQLLVLAALGAPAPRYAHHSLVLGADGGKLSKRHGATSVGEFRDLGYLPQAVTNYLALLSWSHGEDEVLPLERLEREFALEELSGSPAVFDAAKLDWLGHRHVMLLDEEEHRRLVAERLPADTPPQAAAALAAALKPSITHYAEVPDLAAPVLRPPDPSDLRAAAAPGSFDEAPLDEFVRLRAVAAAWLTPRGAQELLAAYREAAARRGLGARRALPPLRLLLTGREHGPELHYVLAAISADDALARVCRGLEAVRGAPA